MRLIHACWPVLLASSLAAQPAQLQSRPLDPPTLLAAIEQSSTWLDQWRHENHIPGLSVTVAVDGNVIWSEGFGWADLEQRVPATPRTRFRLGSVSKMLTAVALVKLAEDGRIDLDTPIQRYVPDFPPKPWPITARQLSAHTAGIRHYNDADFAPGSLISRNHHFMTDRESLTLFEDDPLEFEPGTRANYTTHGYSLLAAVLAGAAGVPYQQVVEDLIAKPLGLGSVGADHPYFIVPDRSAFYVYRENLGQTIHAGFTDNSYKWAGGGYLGSSEDLVRFVSALLEPGYLSEESLEVMFTPQRLANGELAESGGAPVGIGWRIDEDEQGRLRFHHGGSLTGGGAMVMALPNEGIVVAILTNQLPRPTEQMANRITSAFAAAALRAEW